MKTFYILKEYVSKLVEPPFNQYFAYDDINNIPKVAGRDIRYWTVVEVADRDRLADENKRLREALEFYADEENYEIRHVSYGIGPDPFVFRDGGKTARKALGNETIKKETI